MSQAAPAAAERLEQPEQRAWPGPAARVLWTVGALVLGCVVGLGGLSTPPPIPAGAEGFSAVRAAETARALLGEAPRPVGSRANREAAERLRNWLVRLGLDTELQETEVRLAGRTIPIQNVLARRRGTLPGPAVLLMAHHDSVPGSPGAGDDGMGVAVLGEVARGIAGGSWPGRDVILLFTDGEESGLLGARHFSENHRWMREVGSVLNVDNRGRAGPCLIYETGPESADTLFAVAPRLRGAVANSFFAEVARHMPNGSDFMVMRQAGKPGLNFAVIGDHAAYHAPEDSWDAIDLSSLQHQGQTVITSLAGLAMLPVELERHSGDAVFLDLAGTVVAWWPTRTGIVLATASMLLFPAIGWFGAGHRGGGRIGVPVGGIASTVRAITAALVCGGSLWALESAGVFGLDTVPDDVPAYQVHRAGFWPAAGPAMLAAAMIAGLGAAAIMSCRVPNRGDPLAQWCGAWGVVAALVLGMAVLAPGASAPLLPVVLAAGVAAVLVSLRPRGLPWEPLLLVLPTLVAGITLAPIEWLGWQGVGLSMPAFSAARCAVLAMILLAAMSTPQVRLNAATR